MSISEHTPGGDDAKRSDGTCIGCGADLSEERGGTISLGEYEDATDAFSWADSRAVCWLCAEAVEDLLLRKIQTPSEVADNAVDDQ